MTPTVGLVTCSLWKNKTQEQGSKVFEDTLVCLYDMS